MRHASLLLLFALLAIGCDSGDATDDAVLRAPGGRTPVAGAIEWRSPENVLFGILGAGPVGSGHLGTLEPEGCSYDPPPGGAAGPLAFRLSTPYPNPSRLSSTVSVSVGCATHVSVFVVAAIPPGSTTPSGGITQSSWVFRPGGLPVAVLHDGPVTAGRHEFQIDFRGVEGPAFPDGYYRVYVQTPYVLAWTDVLLDRDFYQTY